MIGYWAFTGFLFLILFFISGMLFVKFEEEFIGGILTVVIVLYFGITLVGSAVYDLNIQINKDTQTTQTISVMSLTDNFTSELNGKLRGGLFFTYGQIQTDNKAYYRVMTGDDKIGYIMTDIPVENTRLFFTDDLPKMETDIRHIETCQKDGWFYGGLIKTKKIVKKANNVVGYRLYLPKDSVKVEFNVDMK